MIILVTVYSFHPQNNFLLKSNPIISITFVWQLIFSTILIATWKELPEKSLILEITCDFSKIIDYFRKSPVMKFSFPMIFENHRWLYKIYSYFWNHLSKPENPVRQLFSFRRSIFRMTPYSHLYRHSFFSLFLSLSAIF